MNIGIGYSNANRENIKYLRIYNIERTGRKTKHLVFLFHCRLLI